MAISTEFNTELALVDDARSFTYDSGYSDYGENEWSVDGWTVRGGSDAACEHGASEACYQMGYRWYTPEHTIRPATLPSGGITLARQQFQFPYFRLYTNYGYASWGAYKLASFNKWVALNCANDLRLPVGHAWPGIISAIEAADSFFTNNPTYYIGTIGNAAATFNLALTGADYDALVDRVAAHIASTVSVGGRAIFDPEDASPWTSDEVCGFANAVIAKIHETVPGVSLGIYAYANHRRAPSFPIPNIYVQVALGFNAGGIGYSALVDEWAVVAQRVDLRGYGMIAVQDEFHPFNNGICNDDAFENDIFSYPDYVASGCEGLQMESSGHHVAGLVGHYTLMRFMRDGSTTHADVRNDLETHHPDFKPETKALYEFWATNRINAVTISKSYDLIDALPSNSLSTEIKRYWAWYRDEVDRVETHRAKNGKDDVYYSLLEQSLRYSRALQDDGTLQGYAYSRQVANANVLTDRPDLYYGGNAHWIRFGEYPPDTLYEELKAEHQGSLQRPSELDDTTLALCDVTPVTGGTGTATDFITKVQIANYAFIGPGDVTTPEGTTSYGAGIHYFSADGLVSFSGGLLFLNSFPNVYTDTPGHPGTRFLYIPKMVRGRPNLSSGVRVRFRDSRGVSDVSRHLPPFAVGFHDPRLLDAGQCEVDWSQTRDYINNINCNPWISPQYDRALMPKALAVREGLTILSEY